MNPGIDVFFPVNWKNLVKMPSTLKPPAAPLVVPVASRPEISATAAIESSATPNPPVAAQSGILQRRLIALGLIGLAALTAGVWIITRKGQSKS
jgi:hypothetical protein